MQMDFKRVMLVVVFAISTLMLWQKWTIYNNPPALVTSQSPAAQPGTAQSAAAAASVAAPGTSQTAPVAVVSDGRPADYTPFPRAHIKTDLFEADVSALGGDLIHLEFTQHKVSDDPSKNFVLFDDKKEDIYVARSGLVGAGLPDHNTVFQLSSKQLELKEGADSAELRLDAAPVNGVSVTKVLTFHRGSYLVDVRYEIANASDKPLNTEAYFEFARNAKAPGGHVPGFMSGASTFTGPARFTAETKYKKIDFKDIDKKSQSEADVKARDGWIAMVQHYFVGAFLLKGDQERTLFTRRLSDDFFGAGMRIPLSVAPGQKASLPVQLYAGPQEQKKLEEIAPGLDLVVDYGWMTIIAKPIFEVLAFIHKLVGNWGWSIILLTILIKAVFFPLSASSYRSMAKMKTLMPRVKQLQERYASDKMKLNQEMMALYKTEKVNPMGGCLPMMIQIPVFMALYWVLLGAVEMRAAPWLGWITDLSLKDPYYVLPIIYCISQFFQIKLNPTPPDPVQAKVMMAMPLVFGVMFLWFPSGLVLYWVVNGVLSIAQQWYITRMIEGGKS